MLTNLPIIENLLDYRFDLLVIGSLFKQALYVHSVNFLYHPPGNEGAEVNKRNGFFAQALIGFNAPAKFNAVHAGQLVIAENNKRRFICFQVLDGLFTRSYAIQSVFNAEFLKGLSGNFLVFRIVVYVQNCAVFCHGLSWFFG